MKKKVKLSNSFRAITSMQTLDMERVSHERSIEDIDSATFALEMDLHIMQGDDLTPETALLEIEDKLEILYKERERYVSYIHEDEARVNINKGRNRD